MSRLACTEVLLFCTSCVAEMTGVHTTPSYWLRWRLMNFFASRVTKITDMSHCSQAYFFLMLVAIH
jgi:hypothetical protein